MAGECIESGESGWRMAGECIESGQFSKKSILASTRIRQNWRSFGEYSNLTNSPASGHCLPIPQFLLDLKGFIIRGGGIWGGGGLTVVAETNMTWQNFTAPKLPSKHLC
jgi:hypothetical protein